MIFRITASLLAAVLILSACEGDSRPFSEAVEVRTLDLESIRVVSPPDIVSPLFLNINQGLQLGLEGVPFEGASVALSTGNRAWSVSEPTIASISKDGFVRGINNGPVQVSVTLGGLQSANFDLTIANADLVSVNSINGGTALERCMAERYFATGTFSDGTNRNLNDVTWTVSNPTNAELFELSGSSTKLSASAAGTLSLTASAANAVSFSQPLIVSDNLQRIDVVGFPITLDDGATLNAVAEGFYTAATNAPGTLGTGVGITDNVSWTVVANPANLSVSNVRGSKGLLTGLNEGLAQITAACGDLISNPVLVTVNAAGTSDGLAFKIGDTLVLNNSITLSRSADGATGLIDLRASTGSEYDIENDITGEVDFQEQFTSTTTQPFFIQGNGSAVPTIRLTAKGEGTIVATNTEDGETEETITIRVED